MARNIQTPRSAQELTAEFKIQGGLPLRLDEVVVPVWQLSQRAPRPAIGYVVVNASVGHRSIAIVTAGVRDVHISRILVWSTLATVFYLIRPSSSASTPISTKNGTYWQDFRLAGAPASDIWTKSDGSLPAGTTLGAITTPVAFSWVELAVDMTLPNSNDATGAERELVIAPGADNQDCRVMVFFEEPPEDVI